MVQGGKFAIEATELEWVAAEGGPPGFWFPYGAPGLPSLCRRGTVSVFFVNSQEEAPVSGKSNTGKY